MTSGPRHRERQVGPVEAGGHAHGLTQAEPRLDVDRDPRGGRRRRGQDRPGAKVARRVGEAEVVRAEVVTPLGDAVGLVDDEQADTRLADARDEARRGEALGGDVEEPEPAGDGAGERGLVRARILL
jgi:hypothetical protein